MALAACAAANFGGQAIGFKNAGSLGEIGPSTETTVEGFADTLATNLTGASSAPSTRSWP